jgi:hypothetical protein
LIGSSWSWICSSQIILRFLSARASPDTYSTKIVEHKMNAGEWWTERSVSDIFEFADQKFEMRHRFLGLDHGGHHGRQTSSKLITRLVFILILHLKRYDNGVVQHLQTWIAKSILLRAPATPNRDATISMGLSCQYQIQIDNSPL